MTTPSNIAAVVTAGVAVLVAAGGYVQFVLRRSYLPSVEFDLEFTAYERGPTQLIGELACVLQNRGSSILVVTNVRCRVIYRVTGDVERTFDGVEPAFDHGLVGSAALGNNFAPSAPSQPPVSVPPDLLNHQDQSWFDVQQPRTFVQPGVTQRYRKPIVLPVDAELIHVWGSFDYRIQVGRVTSALIGLFAPPPDGLDWRTGISNHTVRRTFALTSEPPTPLRL